MEHEEEKLKNSRLEQKINILNNVVMKSKLGNRKASLAMNTGSTLEINNNVQVSTISENNGSQTKDTNSSASMPQLIKQSKSNNARSSQNHKSENMQIPAAMNNFNQQLKDYQMKDDKLRLSHTSITNTKNQTSSESSNNKNERPDLKPTPSLDHQLKDYRSKHNRQRLIATTKYQSTKTDREFPTFGKNQKAVSFSKQKGDHRKEQYQYLRKNHNNKIRVNTVIEDITSLYQNRQTITSATKGSHARFYR